VILVAIAAGTVSAGLVGAVLAVPIAAITFTAFEYSIEQRNQTPTSNTQGL
jgi:predicted PurR-regulated permease PerM